MVSVAYGFFEIYGFVFVLGENFRPTRNVFVYLCAIVHYSERAEHIGHGVFEVFVERASSLQILLFEKSLLSYIQNFLVHLLAQVVFNHLFYRVVRRADKVVVRFARFHEHIHLLVGVEIVHGYGNFFARLFFVPAFEFLENAFVHILALAEQFELFFASGAARKHAHAAHRESHRKHYA